jgi:hypothetical protein
LYCFRYQHLKKLIEVIPYNQHNKCDRNSKPWFVLQRTKDKDENKHTLHISEPFAVAPSMTDILYQFVFGCFKDTCA